MIRPVADHAVLVEVGDVDGVRRLDLAVRAAGIEGVVETSPALVNLLVRFDPLTTDHAAVGAAIQALPVGDDEREVGVEHVIDVVYDGADLAAVAEAVGRSGDDVAEFHCGASYQVAMYGFAPGYAYLSGVPDALRLPRKPAPVHGVAAGSVIIANDLCLVTTVTMPTGWWVIGSSPTPILTPDGPTPARFEPGDTVRFRP